MKRTCIHTRAHMRAHAHTHTQTHTHEHAQQQTQRRVGSAVRVQRTAHGARTSVLRPPPVSSQRCPFSKKWLYLPPSRPRLSSARAKEPIDHSAGASPAPSAAWNCFTSRRWHQEYRHHPVPHLRRRARMCAHAPTKRQNTKCCGRPGRAPPSTTPRGHPTPPVPPARNVRHTAAPQRAQRLLHRGRPLHGAHRPRAGVVRPPELAGVRPEHRVHDGNRRRRLVRVRDHEPLPLPDDGAQVRVARGMIERLSSVQQRAARAHRCHHGRRRGRQKRAPHHTRGHVSSRDGRIYISLDFKTNRGCMLFRKCTSHLTAAVNPI